MAGIQNFTSGQAVGIASVSSTSSSVALPKAGSNAGMVENTGLVRLWIWFGSSTVTAVAINGSTPVNGIGIAPGMKMTVGIPIDATHVAAVTASSTSSFEINVGEGA